MLLFLPQMVKQLGLTTMQVGWVSIIPYLCGATAMLVWGWVSDRMAERRWNLFWACMVAATGLVIAAQTIGTAWAVVGMSIAAMGFYGSKGSFWAMPSMILTGTAAASGISPDQFGRQSRRFLRPAYQLGEGLYRQLSEGALCTGWLCAHVGNRVRAGAAHSKSRGATRDGGSAGYRDGERRYPDRTILVIRSLP